MVEKKVEKKVEIRKGMPATTLSKEEFAERIRERFYDPAFAAVQKEIEEIINREIYNRIYPDVTDAPKEF